MKLYEFESKKIAAKYGFTTPFGKLATSPEEVEHLVVKAQVLAGKRGKAGAVKICKNLTEAKTEAKAILGSKVLGETVKSVYCEESCKIKEEYFISMTYDQKEKQPVLIICKEGGVKIEELAKTNPEKIVKLYINAVEGLQAFQAREAVKQAGFTGQLISEVANECIKLWKMFSGEDCIIAEINPLCLTEEEKLVAVGTAAIIDDDAYFRAKEKFPPRSAFDRPPTKRELEAKKIDEGDHRGIAGKYIELDGDIGMMTSGGGGSLTNFDALLGKGGKPANFTEYGGNPPTEKMYKLTKVIATKPELNGLWIVGGIASNTRIDVTFEGIAQALREIKPKYPIVIRRAGPKEKEGLQIMRDLGKELGLDIEVFGAETRMTSTAEIIVQKAAEYAKKNKK